MSARAPRALAMLILLVAGCVGSAEEPETSSVEKLDDPFPLSPQVANRCLPALFETPGAVAVGPRAVLTAAHWFDDADELTLWIRGRPFPLDCDLHPDYDEAVPDTPDLALCLMPPDALEPTRPYESVNVEAAVEAAADHVLLTGTGGTPSVGLEAVEVKSRPPTTRWILEVDTCIVQGDSGSPAFALPGVVSINPRRHCSNFEPRTIVGVNAEGCERCPRCSRLSSTSAAAAWFEKWAREKAPICGVSVPPPPDCRPTSPPG